MLKSICPALNQDVIPNCMLSDVSASSIYFCCRVAHTCNGLMLMKSMLQGWITEVAPFVKTLTKSMVTIGQEGFYGAGNCHADK